MSWDVIIPFLAPIAPLLRDPDVTDIVVNAGGRVFAERAGCLAELPAGTLSEQHLQVAVRNIARVLGDDISEETPTLDARLPDGSRVAAVIPPCSVGGTILAIRKFQPARYSFQELVRAGAVPEDVVDLLRGAIDAKRNILISGGTGCGKTTLLNALVGLIDDSHRLVLIEDTSEIQLAKPNVVRLEARRAQSELPAVTMRNLLKVALRLWPDRILLGEVRGGEAFDLLQALNTGHAGTLCTIHGNSATLALSRFTTCILQSGVALPYVAIRRGIAESLDMVVHLERKGGVRAVAQVVAIRGYDAPSDSFLFDVLHDASGREGRAPPVPVR